MIEGEPVLDLINRALEDWDRETNCGETDPAFQGEIDEDIDLLLEGLSADEVKSLIDGDAPAIVQLKDTLMFRELAEVG